MARKIRLADRLAAGECNGGYAEAIIILSAALSALAAEMWPGDRIDRKRFVEALKNACKPRSDSTRISVPLLIGQLRRSGRSSDEAVLRSRFMDFYPTQVLTGDDVDHDETEILSACPALSRREIRECSYGNVLYQEVRSAFVHEYRSGDKADIWSMAESAADTVSYGNWYGDPDRHIHFPIQWTCAFAESLAAYADAQAAAFPLARPTAWWIDGV